MRMVMRCGHHLHLHCTPTIIKIDVQSSWWRTCDVCRKALSSNAWFWCDRCPIAVADMRNHIPACMLWDINMIHTLNFDVVDGAGRTQLTNILYNPSTHAHTHTSQHIVSHYMLHTCTIMHLEYDDVAMCVYDAMNSWIWDQHRAAAFTARKKHTSERTNTYTHTQARRL